MGNTIIIKREELYKQVWTKPMIELANEYNLSDVGLAKICKKMNIPRPAQGYWRKLETGKNPGQVPLPTLRTCDLKEYELTSYDSPKIEYSSEVLSLIEDEKYEQNRITVPEHVDHFHQLISKTRKESQTGTKPDGLDIADKSLTRALVIFDTLIKELEKRKYAVEIQMSKECRKTVVNLRGESIRVRMYESNKRNDNPSYNPQKLFRSRQYYFEPSGILELHMDEHLYPCELQRKVVRDTKTRKLEERLNEFIILLIKASEHKKRKIIHIENERKEKEEAERQRREFENAYRNEKQKVEELDDQVDRFFRANQIRIYTEAAIKQYTLENGEIKEGSEFANWIMWANDQADRVDPLKESPHSILDEVKNENSNNRHSSLDEFPSGTNGFADSNSRIFQNYFNQKNFYGMFEENERH